METSEQTHSLWQECLTEAAELEAFEPRLSGLATQIANLERGQALNQPWLNKSVSFLQNEGVTALALKLNQLAGLHYTAKDMATAKTLCHAALTLHSIATGDQHPDSQQIASNLEFLNRSLSIKLPRLKNFSRRKK